MCIFKKKTKITTINEINRKDIINTIYSASLEFGKNWWRPIDELAHEQYPLLPVNEVNDIVAYLYNVRKEIFEFVEKLYYLKDANLVKKTEEFIKINYSWMNEKNMNRSIGQGQYYAWHD
jgi:hypothetical protein